MNLDEFLYKLHYESEKIIPSGWEANWNDAPLPFKLYRELPAIKLSSDIPFALETAGGKSEISLETVSHLLWFTYGLTQISQTLPFEDLAQPWTMCRRFVPSGGALYPNELYLYLKIEDLPAGIYHYDVSHHRLVCLREGNFDDYLTKALGGGCDIPASFCTVFISVFFWKNFFKYHNFSYRLQGLDTGFVISQLLETGKRLGMETGVYYQFLDRAVNHLIGINDQEESVYAVVPLSMDTEMNWFLRTGDERDTSDANELCCELEPLHHAHYVRSKEIRDYRMIRKLNEASMIDVFPSNQQMEEKQTEDSRHSLILPSANRLTYDFPSASRRRYSPGMDFVLKEMNTQTLSFLLFETISASSYRNDIDQDIQPIDRVSLYLAAYMTEHLPNGAYMYDGPSHTLKHVEYGDLRSALQDSLLSDFVNMSQIPFCFNIVGNKNHHQRKFGYRGHRIQHMEAGFLSHKLLLAASALNLSGHPILGFNVSRYDALYQLSKKGQRSLLQIPVGHCRPHPRLQGSLHT
ncbi:SagB family peptide dehydrogenase [Fictibacillus aquaticus]|uniref:NADH oxidase n=1 Tax=Fictibacillus aquaticus TaxID=2021314 RepID=A0A235F573_9BACL|nr:SagB family peptide dehydrogenase [Fictibacillus aquaticus]OYD56243.1 NADH oxidase [Fictibacillus aquaticus]